jgi:tuftelin-interacting protein 11
LDVAVSDVAALAREGKGVEEKKKWAMREAEPGTRALFRSFLNFLLLTEIHRLQTIHAITQHISSLASTATALDNADPLEPFTADFTKLIEDFRAEYEEYDLDEVVVGAISQVVSVIRSPSMSRSANIENIARAHVQGFRTTRRIRCAAPNS